MFNTAEAFTSAANNYKLTKIKASALCIIQGRCDHQPYWSYTSRYAQPHQRGRIKNDFFRQCSLWDLLNRYGVTELSKKPKLLQGDFKNRIN